MSFLTTVTIVMGAVMLYYIGMITYDVYVLKANELQNGEPEEKLIPIDDQMADFQSETVSRPQDDSQKQKTFLNRFCQGLTPETVNAMMQEMAGDNPGADLSNIIYLSGKIENESPEGNEDETASGYDN